MTAESRAAKAGRVTADDMAFPPGNDRALGRRWSCWKLGRLVLEQFAVRERMAGDLDAGADPDVVACERQLDHRVIGPGAGRAAERMGMRGDVEHERRVVGFGGVVEDGAA